METTYTIEFMRLAEPPLAPIKHPSAFHVAYYCNPRVPLINPSGIGQTPAIYPAAASHQLRTVIVGEAIGKEGQGGFALAGVQPWVWNILHAPKSALQESPCATGMVSAKKINLSTGT